MLKINANGEYAVETDSETVPSANEPTIEDRICALESAMLEMIVGDSIV